MHWRWILNTNTYNSTTIVDRFIMRVSSILDCLLMSIEELGADITLDQPSAWYCGNFNQLSQQDTGAPAMQQECVHRTLISSDIRLYNESTVEFGVVKLCSYHSVVSATAQWSQVIHPSSNLIKLFILLSAFPTKFLLYSRLYYCCFYFDVLFCSSSKVENSKSTFSNPLLALSYIRWLYAHVLQSFK